MTRSTFLIGIFAASVGLTATPAWAQRSASSGEPTGGSAVSRGGDSGSSGGSSSGGSSSGVYSAPSSGTYSAPPSRDHGSPAPARNAEAQGRSRGGREGSGSGRAVPRGSSGDSGSTTRTSGATAADDRSDRTVPATGSRPRGGRAATGSAVDRTGSFPGGGGVDYRSRYFYPGSLYSRYYFPGYGFGLGYFYDPFLYDPFYYGFGPGYGYTYGYPYGGYAGGGYGGGYGGSYGGGSASGLDLGSLRLKIKPRDAKVYVDGYYVGTVDDFDGIFQKLKIEAGGHRIEVRAEGYEVASFDVLITPGETITYEGDLEAR